MNLSSKMRSSPKEAMASLLAEEMASCDDSSVVRSPRKVKRGRRRGEGGEAVGGDSWGVAWGWGTGDESLGGGGDSWMSGLDT